MNLSIGATKSQDVSNKTIRGFGFTFNLTNAATNTAFSGPLLYFINLKCKITLRRFGNVYTIFNDSCQAIFKESAFFSPLFSQAGGSDFILTKASSAGVAATAVVYCWIDTGIYNLQGDDIMTCEVTFNNATVDAQINANSTVDVNEIVTSGTEYCSDEIQVIAIPPTTSNYQTSFKDKVKQITFINLDVTSNTQALSVLSTVGVQLQQGATNDSYNTLLGKRDEMIMTTPADALLRYQSFVLSKAAAQLSLITSLSLTFTAANVVSSNNYLVIRSGYVDLRLLNQARANVMNYQANVVR